LDEHDDVTVVGWADNGRAAIKAIAETSPELVFLDVEMPRGSGLDVVREVGPSKMPVTVFVTAHGDFAVEAFELAAADYLLKPYSDERFDEAFRRARARVEMQDLGALREQLKMVLETGSVGDSSRAGASPYLKRIAVQSRGRMRVIPVDEIDYVAASGVYAELHTGDESHLTRTSLNALEELLDPDVFFRVHRSAIVRLDDVEVLIREGGGSCLVQLKSGATLPVGRSRREELEVRLGRI
jgi:two-component system LytT family response regulator